MVRSSHRLFFHQSIFSLSLSPSVGGLVSATVSCSPILFPFHLGFILSSIISLSFFFHFLTSLTGFFTHLHFKSHLSDKERKRETGVREEGRGSGDCWMEEGQVFCPKLWPGCLATNGVTSYGYYVL